MADRWTTDDGLPSHVIESLDQSADGRLWIATVGGIASFDGHDFTVYSTANSAVPSDRIGALHAATPDSVWFLGGALGLIEHGVARVVARPTRRHGALSRDGEGRLWMAARRMTSFWDGDTLVERSVEEIASAGPVGGGARAPTLWRDAEGRVWAVGPDATSVGVLTPNGYDPRHAHASPSLIIEPAQGRVLLSSLTGDRMSVSDTSGAVLATVPAGDGRVPRIRDRRGRLWVSRGNVMEAYESGIDEPVTLLRLEGQPSAVLEDREGNVWVGTARAGLYRIRPVAFRLIATEQGLPTGGPGR